MTIGLVRGAKTPGKGLGDPVLLSLVTVSGVVAWIASPVIIPICIGFGLLASAIFFPAYIMKKQFEKLMSNNRVIRAVDAFMEKTNEDK